MSGVTVFCFWASYAVAFGLEVSRLLFRSQVRQFVLMGFAGAGLLAHTLFLFSNSAQSRLPPLSSLYDWLLVLAWILVALYLYLTVCYRELALGVFLLPLVLGLVAAAGWFIEQTPRQLDLRFRAILHGGPVLLGSAAVAGASLAGLMYLVQSWRLKHKRRPKMGLTLPNLELLERINHAAVVLAFGFLTLGFGSGVALAIARQPGEAWAILTDPTMIAASLVWGLFGGILLLRHHPRLRGRIDALLTLAAFVFLMLIVPVMWQLEESDWHREQGASTETHSLLPVSPPPAGSWSQGGRR